MGLFGRSRSIPTVEVAPVGAGLPAVSLSKVLREAPALENAYKAAAVSLDKQGLSGIRAQVVLVLDHSGSMSMDYENNKVQQLVDRALAFGLNVDIDGTIEVIPFDSVVKDTVVASMSNYNGLVSRKIYQPHRMGSTNLAAALSAVKRMVQHAVTPVYCMVVTDGEPDDRSSATKMICELSHYPVFIKFLAIHPVAYLQELDDLPIGVGHPIDNVDAKFLPDVNGMSDEQFADALSDEWSSWIRAAWSAGIVRGS